MKRTFTLLFFISLSVCAFAQGEVGIGTTTTPAEKLDVNGAIIIRGAATGTTAGTIQWDASDGFHDGRTSAASWDHLENENRNDNGDYTSLTCGFSNYISAGVLTGTSTAAIETPFSTQYSDARTQYLYYASDLVGGGLCAGAFDSIAFYIETVGSPSSVNGFTLKLKNTSTTALTTSAWETGMTTIYSGSFTLVSGLKQFFASGFIWDGSSNLLVEVCYDNGSGVSNATVDVQSSGIPYVCARTDRNNLGAGSSGCALTVSTLTDLRRPVLYIKGNTTGPTSGISDYIIYDKGVVVGTPVLPIPYEHHGPGTLTAQAVYDENLLISDYVFDKYLDGSVKEEDKEMYGDFKINTIDEMANHISAQRHLPTMTGRNEWNQHGKLSVGKLSTELWVTLETQSIYIKELHERTATLENIINTASDPLLEAYLEEIKNIEASDVLTEAEKKIKTEQFNKLIEALNSK